MHMFPHADGDERRLWWRIWEGATPSHGRARHANSGPENHAWVRACLRRGPAPCPQSISQMQLALNSIICCLLQIISRAELLPAPPAEPCHVTAAVTDFTLSPERSPACLARYGCEGSEGGGLAMETT